MTTKKKNKDKNRLFPEQTYRYRNENHKLHFAAKYFRNNWIKRFKFSKLNRNCNQFSRTINRGTSLSVNSLINEQRLQSELFNTTIIWLIGYIYHYPSENQTSLI